MDGKAINHRQLNCWLPISTLVALGTVTIQAQIPLPQWSEEEAKMHEFVEPELGTNLFPSTTYSPEAVPEEAAIIPEEVVKEDEVDHPPVVEDLPADLLEAYFPERLTERVLDPQELLTQARLEGILNFLDYHFRETRSAVHLLILKPNQRIPAEIDLKEIHREWFGNTLSVLVIYNFGNPDMCRVIYGDEVETRVSQGRRSSATLRSIDQAIVVANAEDQLERFLTEISRRLYWIEDEFHGAIPRRQPSNPAPHLATPAPQPPSHKGLALLTAVAGIAGLSGIGAGIIFMQRRASRKTYYFPDRRIFPRLGGAFGGGNRVVISFREDETPPNG